MHLIGNSLGGAVCVKVAATRPDLIKSLTLVSPALPDSRPRLDLLRFPVVGLPRVGPRLIRQYQAALPPERRVGAVIATCYSNPGLFPQARFAAEVAELNRRDSLEYAAAALMGSARALTAEFLRKGRHSAWRDVTRVTAPSLVIYGQQRPAGRRPGGGPGRASVRRRQGRGAAPYRARRAHGAPRCGGRRDRDLAGNSRWLPPVDAGTGGGS